MIGQEDVKLSGKQIDELVDLIDKEEFLENEEKIEKALAKSKEQRDLQKQKEKSGKGEDGNDGDDVAKLVTKLEDAKHILEDTKSVSCYLHHLLFSLTKDKKISFYQFTFQLDERIDGQPIPPSVLKGQEIKKENTQPGR